ncbi:ABC transporter ATP-binding protein [Streptomyces sp. DSM 15324]|uniref:ABC transporter ATP-binding protein n=1 Tax=Streptomyces sp. DSM 15324 TaxID=1739111 RepID=UPI0007478039|nr:ABC transporter ATP-binding protein [Streptomyces sp. DSM 15324]KUO12386.1 ABC transporter [Streptomyces sp. DSM 15324]
MLLSTGSPVPSLAEGGLPIRAENLHRSYGRGRDAVRALRGVDVSFAPGTFTAVMGPSGSGKSTLLQCLAGIDRQTSGTVHWGTTDITALPERRLALLRRAEAGFIFQSYNLMPAMTVEQNVALPARLAGDRVDWAAVTESLAQVGLADRRKERPGRLSGGQQQRVAVARALYTRPRILFADEPTGALDRSTGRDVLGLLREGVEREGRTCVMVTHDPLAAGFADRVVVLADGVLVDDLVRPSAALIAEKLSEPAC